MAEPEELDVGDDVEVDPDPVCERLRDDASEPDDPPHAAATVTNAALPSNASASRRETSRAIRGMMAGRPVSVLCRYVLPFVVRGLEPEGS